MFEELCRKSGYVKIKNGNYNDGLPEFTICPCSYFSFEENSRDNKNTLQSETVYMLKGLDGISPDSTADFVDEKGKNFSINSCRRIDDLFSGRHEFYRITVS